MINNILLLANTLEISPIGGRELLCKLNYDLLKDIYKEHCMVYEVPQVKQNSIINTFNKFRGYLDGLSYETMVEVLHLIESKKIDKIFVDGSNFGLFVKIVKTRFPKIKIYTFFHNVESRFFLGSLKQTKSVRALAVFIVNYLAERKSVKYSDRLICINERDSNLLKSIYGREATDIYSISLEDKLPKDYVNLPYNIKEKFALFVGGTFYANKAGIYWFVEHVVPHISMKTYIVGKGFEKFKTELEVNDKVVVIGEVESLTQWYHDAYIVIAPIFDGSGMKTKVAEALMYGKQIIGTSEAFTGYEEITEQVGCVCHTKDEFISAMETSDEMVRSLFDVKLRTIYEENYSYEVAKLRIESIIG